MGMVITLQDLGRQLGTVPKNATIFIVLGKIENFVGVGFYVYVEGGYVSDGCLSWRPRSAAWTCWWTRLSFMVTLC